MELVFEYSDYRRYLSDWIDKSARGEKSRLAQAARCHIAYVSQVLHKKAQLSPEQGQLLSAYFGHTEDEFDYFLLLISHARAGTLALEKHYERKLRKMRDDRRLLENRLKSKRTLPAETQATYYGAWYYAAIHILVTIPEFRTRAAIAERLGLPAERVASVLEFLEHAGLIARAEDGTYRGSEENVYLGNDSANLDKHHTHWRLRAIHALDHRGVKDALEMHYSSVVSMSRADAPLARKILLEAVEKILAVVRPSKEEELFCYTLDFFEV